MPRLSGAYTLPAGVRAVSGVTIQSAAFNTLLDDLAQEMNTARPITAGGTGANTADDARDNLGLGKVANKTEAEMAATGALRKVAITIGANQNLNTYTDPGTYVQTANVQATAALNYPAVRAGHLEVTRDDGGTFVMQRYSDYNNSNVWVRTRYNGTWNAWRYVAMGDSFVQSNGSPWTPHPSSARAASWNYFYTDFGYIGLGPANAGYGHIYTDAPAFYFNKDVQIVGQWVLHTGNAADTIRGTVAGIGPNTIGCYVFAGHTTAVGWTGTIGGGSLTPVGLYFTNVSATADLRACYGVRVSGGSLSGSYQCHGETPGTGEFRATLFRKYA